MVTNEHESNINAWDAMMSRVAGLPEIERLRVENAAMRPIVEAITVRHDGICMFCRHSVDRHADSCPIQQARAFVAQHPAQEVE